MQKYSWLMKAPFPIPTNIYLCRLKLIGERSRLNRFLSFVNLALFSPSSSEDETAVAEGPVQHSIAAIDISRERYDVQLPGGKYAISHVSNINYQKYNDNEMELVRSILIKNGWNIDYLDESIACLSELMVIQALDYVFLDSDSAALTYHFFKWLEYRWKHTIRSVCSMVYILVPGNMNHMAVDLLSSLVREDCYKEAGYNALFHVLEEICPRRALETTSSMLAKCYIMENKLGVAHDLILQMEHFGIFPSRAVCSMLLKSLLGYGEEEVAWGFMKRLQDRGMVNQHIFTLFIDYYCKKGNLRFGWKILMEMRNHEMKPDVVSYTIVVDFLCKRSYLREASSILFKMVGMGIPPDSVLLSSVINGYCKAEMPDKALLIVDIFNVRNILFVCNSFLTKLCKDGFMVEAANVFQELLDVGLEVDCFCYTTMIGGYCKIGDAKNALKVLGKMLKKGIKLSVITYTVLISSYCKSGDVKAAECLFKTMKEEGLEPDIVVYNTMMDGYGKKKYVDKAYKLLGMMRSSGISPDTVTYNSFIHSLVISGYIQEAKYMLDELIKRGFPTDRISFTNVIGGLSNKGRFKDAFLFWSYMSENHIKPDVVTCSAFLSGYCRAHRMDEASFLFIKMLNAGPSPDLVLYNTMIHGFCSVGKVEEACCLISQMIGNNIMPNYVTLDALVLGYEKNRIKSPNECANIKLQQILLDHGLHVDISSVCLV